MTGLCPKRSVPRRQALDPVQVLPPDLQALMRQSCNQVDVDVREAVFPKRLEIPEHIDGAMKTAGVF